MDIALLHSWRTVDGSPEAAFAHSFARAAAPLGHRVITVTRSDQIEAWRPDFVIALDDILPKLTGIPTFAIMWNPPLRYGFLQPRTRSILSHDGYLVGSAIVAADLLDTEFSLAVKKPKSDFLFVPSCAFAGLPAPAGGHWRLWHACSAGAERPERDIVASLAAGGLIDVEDAARRDSAAKSRRVTLCLHTDDQREADLPSWRLFEAAAAGTVIITDALRFARRELGSAALYIDTTTGVAEAAEQVTAHVEWLNAAPARGERLAARAYEALQRFDLSTLVTQTCDFAASVIDADHRARQSAIRILSDGIAPPPPVPSGAAARSQTLVDVIVRAGGRPPDVLARALQSIARQEAGSYRAIVIDYKGDVALRTCVAGFKGANVHATYLRGADTGLRSSSLWTGLGEVRAPFFAILDDDDTVSPDHFPSLLELAARRPGCGLFYGGTVQVEDDVMSDAAAAAQASKTDERRSLRFLDPPDISRLLALDNHITSNAFMARSALLDAAVLDDPGLEVAEDIYLLLLLAARTEFACTFRPTAFWHWRSAARDNSMLCVEAEVWQRCASRIRRRLAHLRIPAAITMAQRMEPPFVLRLGIPTDLDADMVRRCEARGLNAGEPEGVWTSRPRASLRLLLDDFVKEAPFVLDIKTACPPHLTRQRVRISVDDQTVWSGEAGLWESIKIEATLRFARSRDVLILRIECQEAVLSSQIGGSASDDRYLGVMLRRIYIGESHTR